MVYEQPIGSTLNMKYLDGEIVSFETTNIYELSLLERIIEEAKTKLKDYDNCNLEGYIRKEAYIATGIKPVKTPFTDKADEFEELEALDFEVTEYLIDEGIDEDIIQKMDGKEFVLVLDNGKTKQVRVK